MSWLTSWWRSSPSPSQPATSQSDSSPAAESRILSPASSPSSPAPAPTSTDSRAQPSQAIATKEPNPHRNKLLFLGGATFFACSVLITRRAFARRRLRLPNSSQFYTDTPAQTAEATKNVSGAREAIEALHLATLNVLSFAMMATGGALWYLDINSLSDARKMLRGGLGVDGTGRTEQQAEEDFEEWMASTLARKEQKIATKQGGNTDIRR